MERRIVTKTTFSGSSTSETIQSVLLFHRDQLGRLTEVHSSETADDGTVTDTKYNNRGLPLNISRGSDYATFRYNSLNYVIEKSTDCEKVTLEYNNRTGKVSFVKREIKQRPPLVKSFTFSYDGRGNLITATSSEGQSLFLEYNGFGRITEMIDKDGTIISFDCNSNSKPERIQATYDNGQQSSITVKYDPKTGEILKVESDAGRKVALTITSEFQRLLDVIRPASITMSL